MAADFLDNQGGYLVNWRFWTIHADKQIPKVKLHSRAK